MIIELPLCSFPYQPVLLPSENDKRQAIAWRLRKSVNGPF
jgi:hypothetical protein